MRPIKLSLAPVTLSANAFNATDLTGAGPWTPTTTATADSLGHLVTIVSAANLSAITFTLTGTDADDKTLTESLAGPNAGTVTGTKYFKTLTSVSASATVGVSTFGLGHGAASVSKTIPIEWRSYAAAAITADITGTINFTVQETYANVYDITGPSNAAPWVNISALAAKTADTSSTATVGTNALRFLTNTVTNGATVDLYISQPSGFVQ